MKTGILIIAFTLAASGANAQSIFDRCVGHVERNEAQEAKKLANIIKNMGGIAPTNRTKAEQCLTAAFLEPYVFVPWENRMFRAADVDLQAHKKALKIETENAKKLKKAEAEQRELKAAADKVRSQLRKLEKRLLCVAAKKVAVKKAEVLASSYKDTGQSRTARNHALIVSDTYKACSELYKTNMPSAMVNQSCIDVFQIMGHPELSSKYEAPAPEKVAKVSALPALERLSIELRDEIYASQRKLLLIENPAQLEKLDKEAQKQLDELKKRVEASNCSEFGYDGIYLD